MHSNREVQVVITGRGGNINRKFIDSNRKVMTAGFKALTPLTGIQTS